MVRRDLSAVVAELDRLTALRNTLIHELAENGTGLREIARQANMTHPGVRKVLERRRATRSRPATIERRTK